MEEIDLQSLKNAVTLLENPGFFIKLSDIAGTPMEKAIALLPNGAKNTISSAVQKALTGALKLILKTLEQHDPKSNSIPPEASNWWHVAATATSGAIGGAFGLVSLTLELPISTMIMLRSIADIARSEGADISDARTQLECIQVFAFGGRSKSDDAAESGYFIAREALTKAVTDAAAHIAKYGTSSQDAPAIVRLILSIAQRYRKTVTEKAAAQLVPVVGAIGGALINSLFINHFQNMAHGHFIVLRLERKYGSDLVREKYIEMKKLTNRSNIATSVLDSF